ncbi:MAG: ferritin family protein, partial [Thermoplasmata archaeon]|nr:ferritin family protein [Thermoplasmata archaeon]
ENDMNLNKYSLEDVILSAVRSEMSSNATYSAMAGKVENTFLKEKLLFLADEEEKHRAFLVGLYERTFPGKKMVVPEETPVPMPEIKVYGEDFKLSEVLESAMEAERATKDFYYEMSKLFGNEPDIKKNLEYLASMEWGHYKLLEIERDNSQNFEAYDEYWPMMHVGG